MIGCANSKRLDRQRWRDTGMLAADRGYSANSGSEENLPGSENLGDKPLITSQHHSIPRSFPEQA
jgi:hypothetical protein